MCEPGPQLHSVCRALCILEHLKGPQAKVLMFKNMRRGHQEDPEIYLGMMANINRTVCILENVGIFFLQCTDSGQFMGRGQPSFMA